ncbi:MAG: choice-of-anchor Q domain-containing protein [Arcobacteraceae bacterium]|nr:choice-of-anchor Q domain-containing protein [Arcobacteraceae bacterium]
MKKIFLKVFIIFGLFVQSLVADTTTGLMAHYAFEGNTNDSSTNSYNGTTTASLTYATGQVGQSAIFDGSSSIELPSDVNLSNKSFTISGWFKPSDVTNGMWIMSQGTVAGEYKYLQLNFYNHNFQVDFFNHSAASTGTATTANEWYYYTVTFDNTTKIATIYLNGEQNATANMGGSFTGTTPFRIGLYNSTNFYNGEMDEVKIYDRALSATDVTALYNYVPTPKISLKAHGGVVQFDNNSTAAYVGYDSFTSLDNTQKFTIESWVNMKQPTDRNRIFNKYLDDNNRVELAVSNAGLFELIVSNGANSYGYTASGVAQWNVWSHIAMVYDGNATDNNGKLKLFVDGIPISLSYTTTIPTTTPNLATAITKKVGSMVGMMDEFRLWNTARTASQIQVNLNQQLDGNETGLVAYYNFDERVGNLVVDIAGKDQNGIIEGNVTRLNFLGDGLTLNAGSQITTTQTLSSDGNISLSAWIKPTSVGSGSKVIFHQSGSYAIELYNGRFGANSDYPTNGLLLPLNQWSHITATMQFLGAGSTLYTYYVNGVEVASFSAWQGGNTNNLFIGTTDLSFSGQIAEATAWNKLLTQSEIQNLMVTAPNLENYFLKGYWPLNEGNGTVAKDYSHNENNGTIIGATWINTAPTIYGNNIYTTYNINSWQKAVGFNLSSPSWVFSDSDSFIAKNQPLGLFLHSYLSNESQILIADMNNQISQEINVFFNSLPSYSDQTSCEAHQFIWLSGACHSYEAVSFPTLNYQKYGFEENSSNLFTFTLDSAKNIAIFTTGIDNGEGLTNPNTLGILYDENGTIVAWNDDSLEQGNLNFKILASLSAGNYRLLIKGTGGASVSTYQLNIVDNNISEYGVQTNFVLPFPALDFNSSGFNANEYNSFTFTLKEAHDVALFTTNTNGENTFGSLSDELNRHVTFNGENLVAGDGNGDFKMLTHLNAGTYTLHVYELSNGLLNPYTITLDYNDNGIYGAMQNELLLNVGEFWNETNIDDYNNLLPTIITNGYAYYTNENGYMIKNIVDTTNNQLHRTYYPSGGVVNDDNITILDNEITFISGDKFGESIKFDSIILNKDDLNVEFDSRFTFINNTSEGIRMYQKDYAGSFFNKFLVYNQSAANELLGLSNDSDSGALRNAIKFANSNIIDLTSLSGQTITLASPITINSGKVINLINSGTEPVTITGDQSFRSFIVSDGKLSLEGLVINGGGISSYNSDINISKTKFENNRYGGNGGALNINGGNTFINDSWFYNNEVFADGNPTAYGGAIYIGNGNIEINNSVFSGNSAQDGGAIYVDTDANVNINSTTIGYNISNGSLSPMGTASGGGIYNNGGNINIKNTIIASNTDNNNHGPNCYGTIISLGYNIIGDVSNCSITSSASDIVDMNDTTIGFMMNSTGIINGLFEGSVAIDSGICTSNFDINGDPRPQGNGCDVGAYEYPATTLPLNYNTIGAGWKHTSVIKPDGTLWGWGDTTYGMIGDGTTVAKPFPIKVGTDATWANLAVGSYNTFGIKTDGTLWAWGYNAGGVIGDGTYTDSLSPKQVGIDTAWVNVSVGDSFAIALKKNGTLWALGYNDVGQLGLGDTTIRSSTTQIGTDANWKKVSTGKKYTLAIKVDGTLWGWGLNSSSQLGDGTNINKLSPIQIGTDNNWLDVKAGEDHSLALKSDGTLWAWGDNSYSKLGDGTKAASKTPQQIGSATDWSKIAIGNQFSFAIKTTGALYGWGNNDTAQLAEATGTISSPTQIGTDTTWINVDGGDGFAIGTKSDKTYWTWGVNTYNQIGDGTVNTRTTPYQIVFPIVTNTPSIYNDIIVPDATQTTQTIDGLEGGDTVVLPNARNTYTITKIDTTHYTVIDETYTYFLTNIEYLSFSDVQNILLSSIKNAPIINTTFSNISIQEGSQTVNFELNVTDVDGDNLNITVESNNTSIVTVVPNWSELVTQTTYSQGLDFNISTVPNAFGIVKITINVTDGNLSVRKSFDINVQSVELEYEVVFISDNEWINNKSEIKYFNNTVVASDNIATFTVLQKPSNESSAQINSPILSQIVEGTSQLNITKTGTSGSGIFEMIDTNPEFGTALNVKSKIEVFEKQIVASIYSEDSDGLNLIHSENIFDYDVNESFINRPLNLNIWIENGINFSVTNENNNQIGRVVHYDFVDSGYTPVDFEESTISGNIDATQTGATSIFEMALNNVILHQTVEKQFLKRLDFMNSELSSLEYNNGVALNVSPQTLFGITTIENDGNKYINLQMKQLTIGTNSNYLSTIVTNEKNIVQSDSKQKELFTKNGNSFVIDGVERKFVEELTKSGLDSLFLENGVNVTFSNGAIGYKVYEKTVSTNKSYYLFNNIAALNLVNNLEFSKNATKAQTISTLWTYLSMPANKPLCVNLYKTTLTDICNQEHSIESVFGNVDGVFKYNNFWSYWDKSGTSYGFDKLGSISSNEGIIVKSAEVTTINLPYDILTTNSSNIVELYQRGWFLINIPFTMTVDELKTTITSQSKKLLHIFKFNGTSWEIYAPFDDNNFASSVTRITTLNSDDIVWIEVE